MILMVTSGCSGSKPDSVGLQDNRLSDCPKSPNCVSSDARDDKHRVDPFQLSGDAGEKWQELAGVVENMKRTAIVTQTDHYLHAESTSRIFRFVDDLELLLDRESGTVAVRSASRVGYSDLGANRKRVDRLRQLLAEKNIIQP